MGRGWWAVSGGLRRVVAINSATAPFSSSSSSLASYHTIQAIPREYTGNRVSSKDRAQGRIPTVVFSRDQQDPTRPVSRKQLLTTERKQIKSILKTVQLPFFCSTTFNLQIRAGSGSSHLLDSGTVLPIKVHRDPETGQIFNLVFMWADGSSDLIVDVPIVLKGEDLCPGLKKGGYLNLMRKSLKYQCPVEHIPSKIELDVSSLDIGDKVLVHDIKVHPSLKLLRRNKNMPLCKVAATQSEHLEPLMV